MCQLTSYIINISYKLALKTDAIILSNKTAISDEQCTDRPQHSQALTPIKAKLNKVVLQHNREQRQLLF